MEEDIKTLEEIKKKFEKTMKIIVLGEYSTYVDNSIFEDIKKLINISENLIARYKELEEENENLKNDLQHDGLAHKYLTLKATSIPKSKVKEKLEELDKRIDFLNTELTKCYIEREKLGTETDIDNNETYIFYMEEEKNFREKQKEVLQDLLERSREDEFKRFN